LITFNLPMPTSRRRLLQLAAVLFSATLAMPAVAADLLATAKARGTLRIALEGTYPPFNFKDRSGQLDGYDVDVAKLVAARLGLKPEFVTTEWSAILAGLASGRYDVIISQVGINPKRELAFDFSLPYTYSRPQLIVARANSTIYRSLEELKGKRVGVGQGSVFEQQAKAVPGIEVKSYPSAAENLQDLASGRIDAALNDSLMVSYLLKNSKLPIAASTRVGAVERTGAAFKKGNPQFKAAFDQALRDAAADGSLKAVAVKWFGHDASNPASVTAN
jgi:L-cystine transport system substrate-binding protein